MNSHIDQLAEWWENAEESNDFYPGDTWIRRRQAQTGGYVYDVGRVTRKKTYYETRVLARAPKPAWHDSVVVMARSVNAPEGHREVFFRSEATPGVWIGEGGYGYSDDLRDVTPLIEAKVTDEMVLKALNDKWGLSATSLYHYTEDAVSVTRDMISAALGVESEGPSHLQEETNDH